MHGLAKFFIWSRSAFGFKNLLTNRFRIGVVVQAFRLGVDLESMFSDFAHIWRPVDVLENC